MKIKFAAPAIALAITFAGTAAFAQATPHTSTSKPTSTDMVAMCDSMMHDMMADPMIRKRMNALMQKHMSSMMDSGMMGAGKMNGGMMNDGSTHDGMTHGTAPTPTATP